MNRRGVILIGIQSQWFWIGDQGWEYLDLGRLWQILLSVGLLFWVVILVRGLRTSIKNEHPGNMPWLFLYSSLSIPHGALMGVYRMLAMGFFMFVARHFIPKDNASERAMSISFWSLNMGLAWKPLHRKTDDTSL